MNFRKVLPLFILALASLAPAAVASLSVSRHSQATVLLPDGDFMVIGGVAGNPNTPTASVEIYFTTAAAWGSGGTLTTARSSHTATLLSDGRVLVAGGFNNGTPLQSAEIYNTLTRTWTYLGAAAMTSARGAHTATLLSKGTNAGKALICGGQTGAATAITASCELFDPLTNSFTAFGQMTSPRMGHSANLLPNGNVFASGGLAYSGGFIYLSTNELFVTETNDWRPAAALLEGRTRHSATVLNNGNVLIAGGFNNDDQPDQFSSDPPYVQVIQDQGTKGYMESVELFDPYGARVPLAGKDYDVMPYRNSSHAATYRADSSLRLTGGHGNLPVSYITGSAYVPVGNFVSFLLTPSGTAGRANITGGIMNLKYSVQLSRKATGRIVNGNIYFSLPPEPTDPTLKIGSAEFYLGRTTMTLDGFSIIKDLQTGDGGWLDDILPVPAPLLGNGSYVLYSDFTLSASNARFVSSTLNFAGPLAASSSTDLLTTSVMTVNNLKLIMSVPTIYEGAQMTCLGVINNGSFVDSNKLYTVSFTSGVANFVTNTVTGGAATANNVAFTGIEGIITNTTDYALGSGINAAGQTIDSLGLQLKCTGDSMRAYSTKDDIITFSAAVSTVVVREMVFSDNLGYDPSQSVWDFDKKVYTYNGTSVISTPKFDHNTLLTPAGDILDIGGRNCETSTGTYCLRGVRRFDPISTYKPIILENSGWTPGPKLKARRAAHTSTLLSDGTIFTCGGSDGARTLQSCELLKAGEWSDTGPMNYPRAAHTATLLPNGNVLLAGGTTGASTAAVNTAEIYYPDTRRLVTTTPMNEPRMNHTATLLPDGNVLMVAGSSGTAYSGSSEVFITSAAKWQVVGDGLGTPRSQHTATLLKSGQVLVAGGISGLGAVTSVELYDPATRQWDPAPGNLIMRRYAHTATLLKDGRVLVAGGSNGTRGLRSAEIFNGSNWTYTMNFPAAALGNDMLLSRANHTATLLPNGKVLLTGGEGPSVSRGLAEGFDVDLSTWQSQGAMEKRTNHTTVLAAEGYLLNIGGFSGNTYLDTTDAAYFTYVPDQAGLQAAIRRQPAISTGTQYFDQGDRITLMSGSTNFHGISEASGGGAGALNSSYHNPRVYLQQIDNPSGFMIDMSTRIYSLYGGPNTDWKSTLSSITVIAPSLAREMPHGWYHMRVAVNAQFSEGHTVQVTIPRPAGTPAIATGTVLGTSSITWTWTRGNITAAEGYNVYSATDSVFITTVAFFNDSNTVFFTQTGMVPNTAASIMVSAYNQGGIGSIAKSATYYTLAAVPEPLRVNSASFESAELEWARNNNSELTTYELSMSPVKTPKFSSPLEISTPVPFSVNYTSTSTFISQLSANQKYDFRVRARNGAGVITAFTTEATTITVSGVNNFTGEALSSSTINWSWDQALGATYYEVYDVTAGTESPVFISSTASSSLSQTALSANRRYRASVNAVNDSEGSGPIRGPVALAEPVYTLTVQPLPGVPNVFTNVSTGSLTLNWITNGNSTWTVYRITGAMDSAFTEASTFSTTESQISFTSLTPNTRYFARLAPINGDGIAGTAVDLGSKYTLAKVPASLAAEQISMSGIWLRWDPEDNSSSTIYEVRSSTNENFTAPIVTPVPFTVPYTDAFAFVNGLLTATSYYFDVAARNGEGFVTARKRAPAAFTLPGPSGAPSGAVGGTSDPSAAVTISGSLPNNRTVDMYIPAGSFASATAIAVSSSARNDCGYLPGGIPVAVEVFSQGGLQPQIPVSFTLHFDQDPTATKNDIITNASQLVLARFNPDTQQCLPLETKVSVGERTITATINHFSLFQLIKRVAASNLSNVLIYPNPFYANRGQGYVTIDKIPASSKVRIYTLSGDKVWEATAGTTGVVIWKGVNKSGYLVASGIYLAVVDAPSGKKVFKLAVER